MQVTRRNTLAEYSRYLRSPAIEVTFLRRILVGGAVQKPDVYYIDPTMTVRDVIDLAVRTFSQANAEGRSAQDQLLGTVTRSMILSDEGLRRSCSMSFRYCGEIGSPSSRRTSPRRRSPS